MIKTRKKKPEANELQGIATHDANGNMVIMPGLKAKYDAWNRLTEIRDSSDNLIATYEYNGLNQRIKKTVGSVVTKSFFNENWQELESVSNNQTTSYIWGLRYIDALILREKGEERLYSLADPNWNVIALVNTSGTVMERYTYDAFGKRNVFDGSFTAKANTDYNWNRTFTGQVLDMETMLMLYRNRFFNTLIGRFISRDPIGYQGNDINLYRVVAGKIIVARDPYGLDMQQLLDGLQVGNPNECAYHAYTQNNPLKHTNPKLPDSLADIFACVPSDCQCSSGDLKEVLQNIQNAIDDTHVFPFWPGPCVRWGEDFAYKVAGGGTYIKPSPCLTRNSGMLWEPYIVFGGHAYFEFEICGGTVIRVENRALNFGNGQYSVLLPKKCSKCSSK